MSASGDDVTPKLPRGANLKPYHFQPGQTGNPKGLNAAHTLAKVAREAAGGDGSKMIAVLVEIALDKGAKKSDRITAAEAVLSRGWGKAIQQVDVNAGTNTEVRQLNLDALSKEELEQYMAIFGKLIGSTGEQGASPALPAPDSSASPGPDPAPANIETTAEPSPAPESEPPPR